MRAYCGEAEVTPIHSFDLAPRSGPDQTHEGLYVFDPSAFEPGCSTVRLVLYGEKVPERGEPRTIESSILQQIAQDFALYRDR